MHPRGLLCALPDVEEAGPSPGGRGGGGGGQGQPPSNSPSAVCFEVGLLCGLALESDRPRSNPAAAQLNL